MELAKSDGAMGKLQSSIRLFKFEHGTCEVRWGYEQASKLNQAKYSNSNMELAKSDGTMNKLQSSIRLSTQIRTWNLRSSIGL